MEDPRQHSSRTSASAEAGSDYYESMPVPYASNHSGWMDHAVLSSIASACNLCDVYVHQQVKHEYDMEGKDRLVDQSSFDELDRHIQIQVYKQILFDESSVRIDDDDEDADQPPAISAASSSSSG